MIRLFTIGFTKKTAEAFFSALKQPGLERVIDTRLNNISQLSGFAKKADLRFFLKQLNQLEYAHIPAFAPTPPMLDAYRRTENWRTYEKQFLKLMAERSIDTLFDPAMLDGACLLCSEPSPHHCHRRLVAEYLQTKWRAVDITHL